LDTKKFQSERYKQRREEEIRTKEIRTKEIRTKEKNKREEQKRPVKQTEREREKENLSVIFVMLAFGMDANHCIDGGNIFNRHQFCHMVTRWRPTSMT